MRTLVQRSANTWEKSLHEKTLTERVGQSVSVVDVTLYPQPIAERTTGGVAAMYEGLNTRAERNFVDARRTTLFKRTRYYRLIEASFRANAGFLRGGGGEGVPQINRQTLLKVSLVRGTERKDSKNLPYETRHRTSPLTGGQRRFEQFLIS